ncbi:MAG: hypothetical protein QHH18_03510 [Candidatus Bathyarchaeota archaeon]|nr:hypothetical protein [Candidatus Bathyarchaeota archaeon]
MLRNVKLIDQNETIHNAFKKGFKMMYRLLRKSPKQKAETVTSKKKI